jgi:MFS family permease
VFGHLTHRFGRKKLFLDSLGRYLIATVATGLTWSAASFWAFRFLTGLGIGGAVGPLLSGRLLGGEDPTGVAVGYWIAAGLMAIAAITEIVLGVDAEQESLEDIAEPLSAESA